MSRETEGLAFLMTAIDDVVEGAAAARSLPDVDVRRLLRFISQVIQVVEQAFQDVLGVLTDVSYLEPSDLSDHRRMTELRKNVALLTARSHYRDAAEICSRLKHLGEHFNDFVRPTVQHLPQFGGWGGVFGLIEHREGCIVELVSQVAQELDGLLAGLDSATLPTVKLSAGSRATELRALLSELHALNGRILGYSGRAGFLELTSNRAELEREIRIMVDKSVTHGHRVNVGAGATVSGDLVVANTITDSFKVVEASTVGSGLKQQLETLCKQVEALLPQVPTEMRSDLAQDVSALVAEATKDQPRRKWYELSSDGIIEAAKTCGAIAAPIISTVKSIVGLLA